MGNDPVAEKCVEFPPARPVEKLVRQHDVARMVLFLKTADGRHGDDPAHSERAERPNVRAVVDFVRSDPVPAPVPRQKKDRPPVKRSADNRIRRIPERSGDPDLGDLLESVDLVEAAASDDADGGSFHLRGAGL